ncbi:hypothetical protein P9228_26230 [Mesorhizobium sp. WSM4898]|uniref:hypothetical protein n=1 Tax=Mesorhizobium sp. WSM4898 TaxID=3038544 RepID=UPI0024158442|nr:hypothetical protein [Mesorhizobium sp. WSM4898]MDG4909889.1 hypothetical protein [Mesorhizobium sp. WSM4898]
MAERWQGHRRPRPGPSGRGPRPWISHRWLLPERKLVQSGATIMMHHGALSVAFAGALPRDMSLTIVTNSLLVATALEGHRQASVVFLGGLYDQDKGCSVGTTALSQLEQFNADMFFVADCAVHTSVGLTAFDVPDAEIKRVMCRRSAARVVVATAESIAKTATFRFRDLTRSTICSLGASLMPRPSNRFDAKAQLSTE